MGEHKVRPYGKAESSNMNDHEIQELQEEGLKEIRAAAKPEDLERLRVMYLGRKGALTQILRSLGQLDPEARRALGREANTVKQALEEALAQALEDLKTAALRDTGPVLDVTLANIGYHRVDK